MTATNLARVLDALIFPNEGGYVNHPLDPGGPTNLGITQATLAAHRGRAVSIADVKALTKEEAREIYRASYAKPVRFDDLPSGLDAAVLDFAVNAGPARAVKTLQDVVGSAQDGVMGAITLAAVRERDPVTLIRRYDDARLAFHRRLSTWKTFGAGWSRRIATVTSFAVALARMPAESRPMLPVASAPTPKARTSDTAVTSTSHGRGAATTAGGVLAAAIGQAKDAIEPYLGAHRLIQYAFVALTMLGVVGVAGGLVLSFAAERRRIASGAPV